jgi:hypothetical protein
MQDIIGKFPVAEVIELTELKHAEVGNGPWRLYIFGRDGYHSGGKWFRNGKPKYPKEEISFADAKERAADSVAAGLEVRICDGMDEMVFHAVDGKVTYGATFWNEANPDPAAKAVADRLKGKK